MFNLCTNDNIVDFEDKLYNQIDDAPMGVAVLLH